MEGIRSTLQQVLEGYASALWKFLFYGESVKAWNLEEQSCKCSVQALIRA